MQSQQLRASKGSDVSGGMLCLSRVSASECHLLPFCVFPMSVCVFWASRYMSVFMPVYLVGVRVPWEIKT